MMVRNQITTIKNKVRPKENSIGPIENSTYSIYDPLGKKLLHRLRLGFSRLREHKFMA